MVFLCSLFAPSALPALAEKKPKPAPFALVAGTVFRDSGFTLPGAEVTLTAAPEGKPAVKVKPRKSLTDARGEFAFRVPAGAMRYTVSVKATSFRAQQKQVSVAGDERVDVFFHLEQAAKD